jgi:branched-chain amino acid transport system permease protein
MLVVNLKLAYWIGVVGAVLAAIALGIVSEYLVYRPLRGRGSPMGGFIGAFALLTVSDVGAQLIWGPNYRQLPSPYASKVVHVLGAAISAQRLVAAAASVLLIVAIHVFLRFTRTGMALRSAVEDRNGALLIGVNPNRVSLIAMAIGSGVAGIAGALLAPVGLVTPTMGDVPAITGFIVVVLAGMESSVGVIFAGFALGLAQSYGSRYLSADFTDVYGFAVLIIALMIRPSGLFRKVQAAR